MEIVPGILTTSLSDLTQQITKVAAVAPLVQIDIVDGQFCDGKTVAVDDLTRDILAPVQTEIHLMVADPALYVEPVAGLGFKRLIFHWEAVSDPADLISKIKKNGLEVGIALNPETDVSVLEPYILDIDVVLVMSVHPGKQGSPFVLETLEKARGLKKLSESIVVGIDGGVKLENIKAVAEAGFDYAVVGSAISQSQEPLKAYSELNRMLS